MKIAEMATEQIRRSRILYGLALAAIVLLAGVGAGPAVAQTYSLQIQHAFKNRLPMGPLLVDTSGDIYGVTNGGKLFGFAGAVFRLKPDGTARLLYKFCAQSHCVDGAHPDAGLVKDKAGNLYGTTAAGGTHGAGTVFKLAPDGTETVLHNFCSMPNCADGQGPSGLIRRDGNLYGETAGGGTHGGGTVFELSRTGKVRVLYSFCSAAFCADGREPSGALLSDAAGNLYGMTVSGGAHQGTLGGTVFQVTADGSEQVLYSFCAAAKCADGGGPTGGLIVDQAGNLYGTTVFGGANTYSGENPGDGDNAAGAVFKVAPDGSETVLYSFCAAANCADGLNPSAGLLADAAGNLYGTTQLGGVCCSSGSTIGDGTVFELPSGGGETVLHAFGSASPDGRAPTGPLSMDASGNLYGGVAATTEGTGGAVYELVRQ